MKEGPILFSGPMVRAILEDRKTQTRRVLTPQPATSWMEGIQVPLDWSQYYKGGKKHLWIPYPEDIHKEIICRYGAPGDRLWVRETFCQPVYAGGKPTVTSYRATDPLPNTRIKWKPSIFMPRSASRITLEIKGIRVERLQDISEEDAKAEGVATAIAGVSPSGLTRTYRTGFVGGWNHINAKRGFGWDVNPWVWVIEFQRVH